VTFINSIYFVGLAVGGILFGSLCDRHGRKAALYSATVLAAVSTLLGLLAPTYWVHFVSGWGSRRACWVRASTTVYSLYVL
jgi:MFS family permease